MKKAKILSFFGILLLGMFFLAHAQDKAGIEQKLTSQYALTKTTADKTDIVTAGAILVLKKDNLVMVDVSSSNVYQNTYKDGRITQNVLGKISRFHLPGGPVPASNAPAQRTFVAGEKMWVTGIQVRDNGISMQLYSDAINNIRYGAALSFPFKGPAPTDEQAEKIVAEVFDVQPSDDSSASSQQQAQQPPANGQQQGQSATPAQQAEAPPAAIPPPPPPADEPAAPPKTISAGQTKDEVTAALGKPDKVAKVGTKEIYYYKDLKVIFVNGKVTDVQ